MMALTVQDCLKLPTLEKTVVLGGHKGLNRQVDFVTVMEVTNTEDIVPDFFKKNQMAMSSFAAIKNDVEAQCALLRILDKCHTSGLILFQYGLYLPKVDERVIKVADELNFPLIYLELDNYDIIYTDVIHDITGLIFRTQLNSQLFLPELFDSFNMLIAGETDSNTLLQLLSDHLDGMLLFLEHDLDVLAVSEAPAILQKLAGNDLEVNNGNVTELVKMAAQQIGFQHLAAQHKNKFTVTFDSTQLQLYNIPIVDKYGNNFYLWYLTDDSTNSDILQSQIASIFIAYLNSRNHNVYGSKTELLVESILSRQYERQQHLSAKLEIDLAKIGAVWLIMSERNPNPYVAPVSSEDYGEYDTPLFSGSYQNKQVIFLPKQDTDYDFIKHISSISAKMEQKADGLKHFVHTVINCTDDIADFYELACQNCQAAAIIYPHKKIFTHPELFFAHSLQKLLQDWGKEASYWLDALKPLRQEEDLLKLLEAMLLDTNMNVNESTQILYMHKNTVYYRLKKIRALFGFDPFSQPANHNLAIALALRRLIYE